MNFPSPEEKFDYELVKPNYFIHVANVLLLVATQFATFSGSVGSRWRPLSWPFPISLSSQNRCAKR